MKKLLSVVGYLATMALLASCGGDNSILNAGGGTGTSTVASVQVLASSPQLPSDKTGATTVDISAIVKDANNNVIKDATVILSPDSGLMSGGPFVTDASGVVTGKLSNGGDPTNRNIKITAIVSNVTGSIIVAQTGTSLRITGPSALTQGTVGNYSVLLQDSKGVGISGIPVVLSSAAGNPFNTNPLTTGTAGDAAFTLTANAAIADTISAQALGLTTTVPVSVSNDVFTFVSPATGTEVAINTPQALRVRWTKAGVPQGPGQTINFATTRGVLSLVTTTDAAGEATATVTSSSAGPAVVSATNPEATSANENLVFVASTPYALVLEAAPFTIATGQQSQITAIVRDINGNLVKNQTVIFTLTDVTGGTLSLPSVVTDIQGTAKTVYTAGPVPSAANGVQIQATVQATTVTNMVSLTVARQSLFLVIGTGNSLSEPTIATFAEEWDIIVTDSAGNAVPNQAVQVDLRSVQYRKGYLDTAGGTAPWFKPPGTEAVCLDEDVNHNGILDLVNGVVGTGEDLNSSGKLEAGNVSAVYALPPASGTTTTDCSTVPGSTTGTTADVTTNSQGLARVCVLYPRSYNLWVDVRIDAKATVSGTEFSRANTFTLPAKAADMNDKTTSPPGQISPFGADQPPDCSVAPPP